MRRKHPLARDPRVLSRETLSNGLTVYLQPSPPGTVTLSASWLTSGGSARDPDGQEGAATALAALLRAGTTRLDKREFARTLDENASTFRAAADWEGFHAQVGGPMDAEEKLLGLLAQAVEGPRLEPVEIERVLRQHREALLRQRSEPEELAERTLVENVFPVGHPYHRDPLGTETSLGNLSQASLSDFHRRFLLPSDAKLVVTSATPERRLLSLLERTFGVLSLGPRLGPLNFPDRLPPAPRKRIYRPIPGTAQVEVLLGRATPGRSDPSFPALYLLNEVLGGRPVISRLFQRVRERHGFAYDAGSSLESFQGGGLFVAEAGTDLRHARVVEKMLRKECASLAEHRIPRSELDRIRESLLGSQPLLWESARQAHGLAAEVALFDLPLDHPLTWPSVLRGLSPNELREVAERHLLAPGPPWVVASGPPPRRGGPPPRGVADRAPP